MNVTTATTTTTTTITVLRHDYTGQPGLAFVGAKFYCLHALADSD